RRWVPEGGGARVVGGGLVDLEEAVGGRAAGVAGPLGDALVVEVGPLLTEVEVLHERGAAGTGLERVVGVVDADAGVGREVRAVGVLAVGLELAMLGFIVVAVVVGEALGIRHGGRAG